MTPELDWNRFTEIMKEIHGKRKRPALIDFSRPVGRPCELCGWPLSNEGRKLKSIDCPEHMPDHWKFHERQAYEESTDDKP